jgi:outer membrane lipoprotein-sorting protein
MTGHRSILMTLFAAAGAIASFAAAADDAQTIARISDRLARIGAGWSDFSCRTEFRILGPEGKAKEKMKEQGLPLVQLTGDAELRIWAKRPDKARVEIVRCTVSVLNGLVFVWNGTEMAVYDPVSMRTITSDMAAVLGAQPNKMDTSFGIVDYMMNLSYYDAKLLGTTRLDGVECYRVQLKHKGVESMIMGGAISKTDLYVDTKRLVPVREELYAPNGDVFMRIFCKDIREVKPGLWAPMTIECRNPMGGRAVMKCEWVQGKVLMPTTIEMYLPGEAKPASVAHHRSVKLDSRLSDSLFEIKK